MRGEESPLATPPSHPLRSRSAAVIPPEAWQWWEGRRAGGIPSRGVTSSPQASLAALASPHGSLLCIQDREGPKRALGWPEATAIPGEGKSSDAQVPTLGPPTPKGSSVRSVSHQPLWSLRELGLEAGQQPCGFGSKRRHILQFWASAFISLDRHRCTHVCEPAGTHAACKPYMHMPSGLRPQAREGALGSGWPVADFGGQGDRRGWFEKALLWLGCPQLHTFLWAAAWTGTGALASALEGLLG